MNGTALFPGTGELADLLAVHLQDEEAVLAIALPILRTLKLALTAAGKGGPSEPAPQHPAVSTLLNNIKQRRQRFREEMVRRLHCDADTITVTQILNGLPPREQGKLAAGTERVRRLASELVAINHWLAVHLRIHQDAYQRLLCDLTGTAQGSGRYGPAGVTETGAYRPLIQIQG